ncbi:Ubiquitin carboxyl-terminal hydrolase [Popillia japonica]|uniref:Ubiquitin carboxyl-terminal hydrolase n=1 Tax=Popillia japonica TaxID=7064 RepID=A0AAW1MSJ1_POPJA
MIIRALESINIENGSPITDLGKICEHIVWKLGKVQIPYETDEYKKFMSSIEQIQEMFSKASSNENLFYVTLRALYNGISDPERQPSATMSIVLQLIESKKIPIAVQWILSYGDSDSLERALLTLCRWLSKWMCTPNLGPLVLYFMQGLEAKQHDDILIEVARAYIERLFRLVILESIRDSVGPVVLHILERMQHNPEAFHKVLPHINNVLNSLYKENTESSQYYLHKFVNLFMALMEHFSGHPGLYDDLKTTLEQYHPGENYKQSLNCKSWLDMNNCMVTIRSCSGKVGLNNLGNTCYMNSVLQALYMTKLFRNTVLQSLRDTLPLFSKLQALFALLQFSQRCSLSPNDILNLARPPGFQPGHQHDSSEFLGYLLDILHEQEHSIYSSSVGSNIVNLGASSQECTVVQGSFGGRSLTVSRCNVCGSQSERADSFRELQLSFPNNCANESVQELLDYYLQPERLCGDNQYHCDTCERLTDGERVSRIVEMPRRLILTLKHFRYDPVSQQRTKLLQRIKLDSYLVLDNVRYDLYAAVVHCGSSVDSGHYYTYARDETDWYKFNDYMVFRTQPEELCQLQPPETPYILFYSRHDCVDPEPLPREALSPRLRDLLIKDSAELEEEKKRPVKLKTGNHNGNGDPPPPGCGDGGFINNSHNRYVC